MSAACSSAAPAPGSGCCTPVPSSAAAASASPAVSAEGPPALAVAAEGAAGVVFPAALVRKKYEFRAVGVIVLTRSGTPRDRASSLYTRGREHPADVSLGRVQHDASRAWQGAGHAGHCPPSTLLSCARQGQSAALRLQPAAGPRTAAHAPWSTPPAWWPRACRCPPRRTRCSQCAPTAAAAPCPALHVRAARSQAREMRQGCGCGPFTPKKRAPVRTGIAPSPTVTAPPPGSTELARPHHCPASALNAGCKQRDRHGASPGRLAHLHHLPCDHSSAQHVC